MIRGIRPVPAAALLTAIAIAVPCAAWWAMGTRSVERERAALMDSVQVGARRQAFRLAERLRGRLEGIERAESRRPFFEYSFRYQDPQLGCDCSTWLESPLSRGPVEPLISAHFEIDRQGKLSAPSEPPREAEDAVLAELGEEHERVVELLRGNVGALARAAWRAGRNANAAAPAEPADAAAASASPLRPSPPRDATVLEYGDEVVLVEPFRWHTVEMAGEPHLVALRSVRPTTGSRIQGFVISRTAVETTLASEPYRLEFRPSGVGLNRVAERVTLDGADWEIAISADELAEAASLRADESASAFHRLFFGGAAGALLAGVFVVGLVAQAERTAKQRSRFAASAAHELRTPLAGLRLYGEMLADDLGDPARQRDYARQVANEADRLSRVVSNVLGYSNLERGKLSVTPQPGDLAAAVQDLVDKLRPAVETNGADLTYVPPELPLPEMRFDPDALGQILANLVDNAERYSRDAEDRTIRVSLLPLRESAAGAGETARVTGAEIAVADTGPGITATERRKLFRPFARGGGADSPAGLGLGLTLVASLVQAHGGTIRHEAREPRGSVFRVTLPA